MAVRLWKVARLLVAFAIGVTLLPQSLYRADAHFGLGSVLIVPTLAMAIWLWLTAREDWRAWWLGLVISLGMVMPVCPWVERSVQRVAAYLQQLSLRGVISLSQRIIEPAMLLLVLLCPLLIAGLFGLGLGKFLRWLARRAHRDELTAPSNSGQWRFSIRELLVAFAAIGLLTGWISSQTRYWQHTLDRSQSAFLNRFKASFVSGEVELLAEPRIEEQQRTSTQGLRVMSFRVPSVNEFRLPGISDYRIVAPIKTKDKTLWAVWAYRCNEAAKNDFVNDFVYMFAHAQATDEELLPTSLFSTMRYVEITWRMVDGIPATAGPSATVISVTSPARAAEPIVLTASAPPETVCELHIFPANLATLVPKRPDKKGNVSWSLNIPPQSAGSRISYELRCIQKRGTAEMVNATRGSIAIVAGGSLQQ